MTDPDEPVRRSRLAVLGLVLGLAGVGVALYPELAVEATQQDREDAERRGRRVRSRIDDQDASRLKRARDVAHELQEAAEAAEDPVHLRRVRICQRVALGLGVLGLVLGLTSLVRRGSFKLSLAAILASAMAITWYYVLALIAVTAVIALLLVGWFLASEGPLADPDPPSG